MAYLTYTDKDFALYAVSLFTYGLLLSFALSSVALIVVSWSALAFLLAVFFAKHGAAWDAKVPGVLLRGVAHYPLDLLHDLRKSAVALSPLILCYLVALVGEGLLGSSLSGSIWSKPFPFEYLFWGHLALVTAFRTYILVDHLRKSAHVQSVLEETSWRRHFGDVSVRVHILQAYITGVLTNLSLLIGPLIFYKLSQPTVLREVILLVTYPVLLFVIFCTKSVFSKSVETDFFRFFGEDHERAHKSRFQFTLFHGQHHDAIPSALIASDGVGFLEGVQKTWTRLHALQSVSLFMLLRGLCANYVDIVGHQYIPGVFPYCKLSLHLKNHHMAHHMGSLLPLRLGPMDLPYAPLDTQQGYDLDNVRTRWFTASIAQHERADEAVLQNYLQPSQNSVADRSSALLKTWRALTSF